MLLAHVLQAPSTMVGSLLQANASAQFVIAFETVGLHFNISTAELVIHCVDAGLKTWKVSHSKPERCSSIVFPGRSTVPHYRLQVPQRRNQKNSFINLTKANR